METSKEKKAERAISVRRRPSTLAALHKACYEEDRPMSYIIERAIRSQAEN
jgi:hypothetical protein